MNTNSRFAVAIHILTMLAYRHPEALTSAYMAMSVTTNPVVLRRLLGDLRRAGLVESRAGSGGGWRLRKQPEQITLLDCYKAVKEDPLFGLPLQKPNPGCTVGKSITQALCGLFQEAERALEARLAQTDLAQVLAQITGPPCETQTLAGRERDLSTL
jgi:Rrf2 family protein